MSKYLYFSIVYRLYVFEGIILSEKIFSINPFSKLRRITITKELNDLTKLSGSRVLLTMLENGRVEITPTNSYGARVTSQGQLTLPRELVEEMGLVPGESKVIFYVNETVQFEKQEL